VLLGWKPEISVSRMLKENCPILGKKVTNTVTVPKYLRQS
jgi:hypothetical protein